MSTQSEIAFQLELGKHQPQPPQTAAVEGPPKIPRIARLLALAMRLEGLVREGTIRDYAAAARR